MLRKDRTAAETYDVAKATHRRRTDGIHTYREEADSHHKEKGMNKWKNYYSHLSPLQKDIRIKCAMPSQMPS